MYRIVFIIVCFDECTRLKMRGGDRWKWGKCVLLLACDVSDRKEVWLFSPNCTQHKTSLSKLTPSSQSHIIGILSGNSLSPQTKIFWFKLFKQRALVFDALNALLRVLCPNKKPTQTNMHVLHGRAEFGHLTPCNLLRLQAQNQSLFYLLSNSFQLLA